MRNVKSGKDKKVAMVGVRLTQSEMDALKAVVERVIERSNGLATPDMSAIVKELAHLSDSFYITDADREFIKSRREADTCQGEVPKKAVA